ncbi:MAG: mechanosensitive ion channel [Ignavibacteriaceae bacterium]
MNEWIESIIGISAEVQTKILMSVIVMLSILIIQRLVVKFLISRIEDITTRYQWKKISLYIAVFLIIILTASEWLGWFGSVGTFLGLITAGIAIALRDPLVNMAGWVFIIVRKPFRVGDRIQIGEIAGDVIDLRIFQFSLMEIGNWVDADQSTGRIIHVPNSFVFTQAQANYTAGFQYIWNEIPVLVTFESNWKKAKKILSEIIDKHAVTLSESAEKQIKETAEKFLIFYTKLTPIVYTSVKDSGVLLTIRYLTDVRKRRKSEELIWEEILEKIGQCSDIDFAYPTTRFYNNLTEGKEGTKPAGK